MTTYGRGEATGLYLQPGDLPDDMSEELRALVADQLKDDRKLTTYLEPGIGVLALDAMPQGEVPINPHKVSKNGGCGVHGYASLYCPPGWTNWTRCRLCERERSKRKRATDPEWRQRHYETWKRTRNKRLSNETPEQKALRLEKTRERRYRLLEKETPAEKELRLARNREYRRTCAPEVRERRKKADRDRRRRLREQQGASGKSE